MKQSNSATGNTAIKIDAHVHIHPGFDLERFLDAARANMALGPGAKGFLLLTEMAGVDAFSELGGEIGSWDIQPCADGVTKRAVTGDGTALYIVAGRQIVTQEGIEVLHHGTIEETPDGSELGETLTRIARDDTMTSLPWGFGKWTGMRGGLIAKLASGAPQAGCFLADSGVRLAGSARPDQLSAGEANGWRVIAGTDPLPLTKEVKAIGRYGILADFVVDEEAPFKSLLAWLNAQSVSPQTYGALQAPVGFVINQVAMQIRKRLK